MTVARILDDKGRDVITTQPHRTLKEVVDLLAAKGVGAVVVSDASLSVLGILSERDVVRVIAKTWRVRARGSGVALHDAEGHHRDARRHDRPRHADDDDGAVSPSAGRRGGRLIGIISIGDVVKRHVDALDSERQALREYIATA